MVADLEELEPEPAPSETIEAATCLGHLRRLGLPVDRLGWFGEDSGRAR